MKVMASKALTLLALVLAPALASAYAFDVGGATIESKNPVRRCGQYVEYSQVEVSHGIFLRGGTLLQFVGVAREPNFKFVIQAHGPRNYDELFHPVDAADDSAPKEESLADSMTVEAVPAVEVAPAVVEEQSDSASTSVNRLLQKESLNEVGDKGVSVRESTWGGDRTDDLRTVEETLAMVYPFLFSYELSGNHFDRLIAARARAIHAMSKFGEDSNAYDLTPPAEIDSQMDDNRDSVSTQAVRLPWEQAHFAEDESQPSDSFNQYLQSLNAELAELCNAFADWWVGLPLYLWLLMVVSLVTIVFSAVILCLHCVQGCCESEEETAAIYSCSAGPGVKTPLLEAKDEDAKDASAQAEKSVQYEPPRV